MKEITKNYLKYVGFFLFVIFLSIVMFFIISLIDKKYIFNMSVVDKISITSTFIFGLSVAFFSYLQHRKNVLSEEPKVFFDVSFQTGLNLGDKSKKYVMPELNNVNIFLVIKNTGNNAIYNIKIKLEKDKIKGNKNNEQISLPALFPGELKLFNTFVTIDGINQFRKVKVILDFSDHNFTKQKAMVYDLIKNKEYIVNYYNNFSQSGEPMALEFYNKVNAIRQNKN